LLCQQRSTPNIVGGAWRSIRRSHWCQSLSRESSVAGILLASNDRRCYEASIFLRSMPMILPQDEGSGAAGAANSSIVATAKIGHRHCRKVDSSTRQLHLHSNRSRIFQKMDRSEAAYKRELCHKQKILLAKHNLPIWGTQTHNTRQCKILRQCNVQGILPTYQHEVALASLHHPQSN
jgi:hypothetical protein